MRANQRPALPLQSAGVAPPRASDQTTHLTAKSAGGFWRRLATGAIHLLGRGFLGTCNAGDRFAWPGIATVLALLLGASYASEGNVESLETRLGLSPRAPVSDHPAPKLEDTHTSVAAPQDHIAGKHVSCTASILTTRSADSDQSPAPRAQSPAAYPLLRPAQSATAPLHRWVPARR